MTGKTNRVKTVATNNPPAIATAIGPQKILTISGNIPKIAAALSLPYLTRQFIFFRLLRVNTVASPLFSHLRSVDNGLLAHWFHRVFLSMPAPASVSGYWQCQKSLTHLFLAVDSVKSRPRLWKCRCFLKKAFPQTCFCPLTMATATFTFVSAHCFFPKAKNTRESSYCHWKWADSLLFLPISFFPKPKTLVKVAISILPKAKTLVKVLISKKQCAETHAGAGFDRKTRWNQWA